MDRLTAAESRADQHRAAAALHARGLGPGDRVAAVLPGSRGLLGLVLGALRAGVVPVMVDPGLLAHERDALLADADPALVLDDPRALAELLDPAGRPAAVAGGRAGDRAPALADVPLARPMHYTSGTTGRPKGVWSGVLDADPARALAAEERDLWGHEADDVHLVCGPLHHSAPLRFATATLLAGGDVLLPGRFDAPTVAAACATYRPTTTFAAPVHLQRLLDLPEPVALDSFRLVAHAGAPCPASLKERLLDRAPDGSVREFYGSTEGQVTACSGAEWQTRPGTVGRARPGRTVHVDDDGTIWCTVPPHARFSYWRDPDKTARAWRDTPDGPAFTVGDLGRLDADGYLYLDGRRDDLVVSGGVNVYPAEVEDALGSCPGVEEAAVFGVDDPAWGQRVCAAVVGPVRPEVVTAHARQHLAASKRPKEVHVVASLPRTASGKVRRLDLPRVLGLDGD